MFSAADHEFMEQALELAGRGLYTTTPNPRVGCVIVGEGAVVGTGWHEKAGMPHAEVLALKAAGVRSRGATLYVNLEPCSHHGRTPPCVDAVIAAGVKRVVAAMQDPNPKVSGAGFAKLRAAGITVEHGLKADEARELKKMDDVAYIRFASVYEDFQRVDDFRDAILEVKKPGTKRARRIEK